MNLSQTVQTAEEFRGWIPTIGGHLSFSEIGGTDYPSKVRGANVFDDETRLVTLWQLRGEADDLLPLPRGWFEYISERWRKTHYRRVYILLAHAKNTPIAPSDNAMLGKIFCFIYPYFCDSNSQTILKIEQLSQDLHAWHLAAQGAPKDSYDEKEKLLQRMEDLGQEILPASFFSIDFVLKRNGIVSFNFSHVNDRIYTSDNRIQAQQAYFFLRDIAHTHHHHSPRADTLMRVYRYDPNQPMAWAIHLLRSLYRKVIELRRQRDPAKIAAARGVLAYASSLSRTYASEGGKDWNLHHEEIAQSVTAKESQIAAEDEKHHHRTRILIGAALPVLAIIVGMSSAFSGYGVNFGDEFGSVHMVWKDLFRLAMHSPILFYVGLVVIFYYINFIFRGRLGTLGPYEYIERIFTPWSIFGRLVFFLFAWIDIILLSILAFKNRICISNIFSDVLSYLGGSAF